MFIRNICGLGEVERYHQRTFCWNPRKISAFGSYLIIAETKGNLGCFVEAQISNGAGSHHSQWLLPRAAKVGNVV